ncbi:Uncharacterised protein [Lelliottia amnigena]|jgi:hypothetical protein|nr:hypothetical protein [Lelliottia amnigena]CAI9410655.1 hypothetical protein CCAJJPOJ_01604 [Lelliottia sp. T2.26D-8]VDZ88446.1 Uncharacterised protein [Lelliottia amnigena]
MALFFLHICFTEMCANENVYAYDLCPAKTAILMTDS